MQLVSEKKAFNQNLYNWYQENHRKLPWRTNPSLYKTVVSEFMLQQTQVDTVLPYFDRWLKKFPNFEALAQAEEDSVVKQWEGLGYYSRARNLHKLAKELVQLDKIPETAAEWINFPGIGPYSSAAIASIAFGDKSAVVDGNVIRVLSRLCLIEQEFKDNSSAIKELGPLANQVLYEKDPNTHNQAMMELGATICTKANPLCTTCPVLQHCQAAKTGIADKLPKISRKKTKKVKISRLWHFNNNKLLISKACSQSKRLASMHELPVLTDCLARFTPSKTWIKKKRGISNEIIEENIYKADTKFTQEIEKIVKKNEELSLITLEELSELTLSGPHRRWINELLMKHYNILLDTH